MTSANRMPTTVSMDEAAVEIRAAGLDGYTVSFETHKSSKPARSRSANTPTPYG